MTIDEGPENLVLRYLREIDRKVGRLGERVDDLHSQMTFLERHVSLLNDRFDYLVSRIDRIDVRLAWLGRDSRTISAVGALFRDQGLQG